MALLSLPMRILLFFFLVVGSFGCTVIPSKGSWGGHWVAFSDIGSAAVDAVKDPQTWIPLVGAALLSVDDFDEKLSESIANHRPVFGSHADEASDRLSDIAVASYFFTAFIAPSDNIEDKLSGIGIGVVTLRAQGSAVGWLKDAVGRKRPLGGNKSFPSSHTSRAATAATLTERNLAYIEMPQWARIAALATSRGLAIGTGWARVEAEEHYMVDVLAGYALGHFFAAFMHNAFIENRLPGAELRFQPVENGGALRLTVPLGGH